MAATATHALNRCIVHTFSCTSDKEVNGNPLFCLVSLMPETGVNPRKQFFNLFNRADFFSPTSNLAVFDQAGNPIPTAGLITSTQTPSRQIQFALRVIWWKRMNCAPSLAGFCSLFRHSIIPYLRGFQPGGWHAGV